ncbi:LLM class flavin-dependent oxidoreductase [Microbacterium halotolerans]|uniref:LLM class flavin-dependent oxidoreductase n=1 Tax=Microbacterium halotolerans TaxID=246613 RepID=UPI000E6AA20E|nr:LLM class flavin-dependent oxidoreductase [Microbacterium halotolerans]
MTVSDLPDVGVMLPRDLPIDQVLPFARRAEELGFVELWVVEDLGFRGGVAQAATVLSATTTIRVGVGILPAGARNVAFAAMEAATLAQLHPNRVTIGIGHGMPEWMRQVGAWPASPLGLLRDWTRVFRTLLRGDVASDAQHVHVEGTALTEIPSSPPSVLLGVRGPRSLEAAGDVADGVVLAEPSPPPYIASAIARMDAGGSGPHRVVAYDLAAVAGTDEEAYAQVRPALAPLGEPDWRPHLLALPFVDDLAALRSSCGGPDEFAAALPDEWIPQLALAGTVERVRSALAARRAAGASTSVLIPVADDPLAALSRLATVL